MLALPIADLSLLYAHWKDAHSLKCNAMEQVSRFQIGSKVQGVSTRCCSVGWGVDYGHMAYVVENLWIILKMKEAFRVFLEDRGIAESKYLAGSLDAKVALVAAFEKSVEGSSRSHIECI